MKHLPYVLFSILITALLFSGCTGDTEEPVPELTRTVISEEPVCRLESKVIGSPIVFSPDAERIAYIAQQDEKRCVVIDGIAGDGFDQVYPEFSMFSPDSTRTAYKAMNYGETRDTNSHFVVIDGETGAAYDSVSTITFSPDSSHIAYIANDTVYLDRKPVELPEDSSVSKTDGLFFSTDNALAFVLYSNGKSSLVVDGIPGDWYLDIGEITFSPDGRHLAYSVETEDGWIVVNDGVPGNQYDSISEITFSPDSNHIAYVARQQQGMDTRLYFVVRDGEEGEKSSDSKTLLTFSPDSQNLLYASSVDLAVTQSTLGFLAVDDEKSGVTDGELRDLKYSPDGTRTAYLAYAYHWSRQYEFRIVVDGKILGQYQFIKDCTFSPDSRHMVYTCTRGQNICVFIDKTEGNEYGSFGYESAPELPDGTSIQNLVFDSDDTFHYLVNRDNAIYIIREKIEVTP